VRKREKAIGGDMLGLLEPPGCDAVEDHALKWYGGQDSI